MAILQRLYTTAVLLVKIQYKIFVSCILIAEISIIYIKMPKRVGVILRNGSVLHFKTRITWLYRFLPFAAVRVYQVHFGLLCYGEESLTINLSFNSEGVKALRH